jgi:hypothetical protein
VSTVDDGSWFASTVDTTSLDEANEAVDKLYTEWPWETKLPSEEELNEFLCHFKMWGKNSG